MSLVAIDGPAGSGKSTIAARLARRLGVPHVDTGAFYRAAALAVLRAGVDVRDEASCERVVRAAQITREGGRTFLDTQDVEEEIRGPEVTAVVSAVSAHAGVRRALLEAQRAGVCGDGAVVEGRDAGTVVAPDADLKVWLTATPQERARRRARQLGDDSPAAVATHEEDIKRRDAADADQMGRAPDAVSIDTTGWEIDALVEELARLAVGARQ